MQLLSLLSGRQAAETPAADVMCINRLAFESEVIVEVNWLTF